MENNSEEVSTFVSNPQKKNFLFEVTTFSKILAAIVFITLPFVGFYIGTKFTKDSSNVLTSNTTATQDAVSITSDQESANQGTVSKSGEAVLVYYENVSKESADGRTWPTISIWKKVGDNAPQLIATVGRAGEYPANFAVSSDKKYLAVNLESKLILINLATKESKTVFTPKNIVGGEIAFSPDSTKIAVADGNYYVDSTHNALYSIDVVSGATTLLDQRDEIEYDGIESWRPDNKLILALKVPKGGAAYAGKVFDLNTKELGRLSSTGPLRSSDGLWLAQSTATSKSNVCEYSEDSWWVTDGDFRATFPSEYSIIDPVTQSKKGTIVAAEKIVQPIAFSKNNNDILYRVIDLPKKLEDCSDYLSNRYPAPYIYYTKDLTSGKVTLVDDYESVLASWRADTTNAVEEPDDKPTLSVIAKYYE